MIGNTSELEIFLTKTIEQSITRHQLEISEPARAYVTGMLMRFAGDFGLYQDNQENWLEPITFQYQRLTEATSKLQRTQLQQDLGDHCLFLVGYFYDFVQRSGQGMVQYHLQMGSNAYQQIGKKPFVEVGQKFNELYLVIGDLHLPQLDEKRILKIYGHWEKTSDKYYASLLLGKGIVPKKIRKDTN